MRAATLSSVIILAACLAGAILLSHRTVAAPPASVVVCHVPPGNPARAHALRVSPEAVDAHLAHGDTLGECAAPPAGCTSNADCAPEDYCEKEPGDCDGTGTCVLRPDFCTTIFEPVCACDGMTYSNACFAASAGQNVAHEGPC